MVSKPSCDDVLCNKEVITTEWVQWKHTEMPALTTAEWLSYLRKGNDFNQPRSRKIRHQFTFSETPWNQRTVCLFIWAAFVTMISEQPVWNTIQPLIVMMLEDTQTFCMATLKSTKNNNNNNKPKASVWARTGEKGDMHETFCFLWILYCRFISLTTRINYLEMKAIQRSDECQKPSATYPSGSVLKYLVWFIFFFSTTWMRESLRSCGTWMICRSLGIFVWL